MAANRTRERQNEVQVAFADVGSPENRVVDHRATFPFTFYETCKFVIVVVVVVTVADVTLN